MLFEFPVPWIWIELLVLWLSTHLQRLSLLFYSLLYQLELWSPCRFSYLLIYRILIPRHSWYVDSGPVMFGLFLLYNASEWRARWRYLDDLWHPDPVPAYLTFHTEYAYGCYRLRGTRRGYDQDRRFIWPSAPARNVLALFIVPVSVWCDGVEGRIWLFTLHSSFKFWLLFWIYCVGLTIFRLLVDIFYVGPMCEKKHSSNKC